MEKFLFFFCLGVLPPLSLLLLLAIIILLVFIEKYKSEIRRLRIELECRENKEHFNDIMNKCRISALKKFGVKDERILNTRIDYIKK